MKTITNVIFEISATENEQKPKLEFNNDRRIQLWYTVM